MRRSLLYIIYLSLCPLISTLCVGGTRDFRREMNGQINFASLEEFNRNNFYFWHHSNSGSSSTHSLLNQLNVWYEAWCGHARELREQLTFRLSLPMDWSQRSSPRGPASATKFFETSRRKWDRKVEWPIATCRLRTRRLVQIKVWIIKAPTFHNSDYLAETHFKVTISRHFL